MDESEKKTLQQSLREAWLGVLGVLSQAEEEAMRTGQRILEAMGLGGEGPGEGVSSEAERTAERGHLMGELMRRVRLNHEALERRVDEEVRQAVARIRRPLAEELATLRGRVEQLQRRIEAMHERRRVQSEGGSPPTDN
ncbi:MAG TPA: phasin family protein [Polyangia bacterium]|jgi:hypothetical protein|nr:phasin family protein [Polyangia bacterium]